jgi:hypothetical protein
MAIPWLIVLQNIPWREVITNAPRVADEAKKLWITLSRPKTVSDKHESYSKNIEISAIKELRDVDLLASKVLTIEALTNDLHAQMLESTKLIKVLADQNTQLVQHIEKNRRRIKLLSFSIFILLIAFVVFVMRYTH